jgi:hypothetical protein
VRIVGKRVGPAPALHWSTPEAVRFTRAASGSVLLYGRRGVTCHRSHAEADADMRRLIADGMVRQAATLVRR